MCRCHGRRWRWRSRYRSFARHSHSQCRGHRSPFP
uniref:Uncharacterized protein n=1 Tax=Arundo donax TaxID=35708 RepID=A0A0A9E3E6_ARUDO